MSGADSYTVIMFRRIIIKMYRNVDKKNMKKIVAALISLLVVFALAGCGNKDKETAKDKSDNKSGGGIFQSMKTTDLDGKNVDSSVFKKNRLTVVNVWNTGCAPCVAEMPELQKISEKYKGKKVGVMGIMHDTVDNNTSKDVLKKVRGVLKKAGAKYRQLVISEKMNEAEELTSISALPATFFVDSEGKIIEKVLGSHDYADWASKIEEALKKVK